MKLSKSLEILDRSWSRRCSTKDKKQNRTDSIVKNLSITTKKYSKSK